MGILSACSGGSKPENTVNDYFKAAQNFDGPAMTQLLAADTSETQKELSNMLNGDEAEDGFGKYLMDYMKGNAKKMTYQVKSTSMGEDKALVTVESKYLNAGPVYQEVMGEVISKVMGLAFSGKQPSEEEISALFDGVIEEKAKGKDLTFKTEEVELDLIKKDGKWLISDVDEDMADVMTSGFIEATESMGELFNP